MTSSGIWKFILDHYNEDQQVVLLLVLEHQGSSPGRQGFKMAVTVDRQMFGSIGGGIMEYKLVEKAFDMLVRRSTHPFYIRQIHHKEATRDRSGMICSGEQTVVILPVLQNWIQQIEKIQRALNENTRGLLEIQQHEISFSPLSGEIRDLTSSNLSDKKEWVYREVIPDSDRIIIIGAGHVGAALCRQMKWLGFEVILIDDRKGLNTFQKVEDADQKWVIPYDQLREKLELKAIDYLVIMSIGYRTDKLILQQLIGQPCRYKGMLGSRAKIEELWAELINEGYSREDLHNIEAPVGLSINSQTPEEIAVSIAAQIIAIRRNR